MAWLRSNSPKSSSNEGALSPEDFKVWQHTEVRFDQRASALALRRGEVLIDSLDSVEDTKGNTGGPWQCALRGASVAVRARGCGRWCWRDAS